MLAMSLWVGVNKLWIWAFDSTQNPVQQLPCRSQWILWPCVGKLKSCNSQHSHWWQHPLMYSSMLYWCDEVPSLICLPCQWNPYPYFLSVVVNSHTMLRMADVSWLVLWMASSIQSILLSYVPVVILFNSSGILSSLCTTPMVLLWYACVLFDLLSQVVVDVNGQVMSQWSLC